MGCKTSDVVTKLYMYFSLVLNDYVEGTTIKNSTLHKI